MKKLVALIFLLGFMNIHAQNHVNVVDHEIERIYSGIAGHVGCKRTFTIECMTNNAQIYGLVPESHHDFRKLKMKMGQTLEVEWNVNYLPRERLYKEHQTLYHVQTFGNRKVLTITENSMKYRNIALLGEMRYKHKGVIYKLEIPPAEDKNKDCIITAQ